MSELDAPNSKQQRSGAVLVPGWMHDHALDVLTTRFDVIRTEGFEAIQTLPLATRESICAIACRTQISATTMDALPNLRIISSYGVGYDPIDVEAARSRNIVVTNTPEVLNEDVADTAVGLLINVVRELSRAEAYLRAGSWASADYPLSRLTLRNAKSASMAWVASASASRGVWSPLALKSPITTGAR